MGRTGLVWRGGEGCHFLQVWGWKAGPAALWGYLDFFLTPLTHAAQERKGVGPQRLLAGFRSILQAEKPSLFFSICSRPLSGPEHIIPTYQPQLLCQCLKRLIC